MTKPATKDGAWCEFCQRFHASETCFEPGKKPMTEYERQYALLKDANEKLTALIKHMRHPGKSVAPYLQRIAELKQENKALAAQQSIDTERIEELKEKYHELLYAVHRKFPGESRHETALRYIHEAETSNNEAASCSKVGGE